MAKILSMEEAQEKKALESRKKRRAGSIVWVFVLLFCLACGLGGYFFSQSSFFDVKSITVEGNKEVSTEEILKLSGIEKGQHIESCNFYKAKLMVETNFWVRKAEFKKVYPDAVEIKIEERKPVAMIQEEEALYLVDLGGMVLNQQKIVKGLPYLIFTGIDDNAEDIIVGNKIHSEKLKAGLNLLAVMSGEALGISSEIDMSNLHKILIHTTYGVDMKIGDTTQFNEKFQVFMNILQDEANKSNISKIDYIDVTVPTNPSIRYITTKAIDK